MKIAVLFQIYLPYVLPRTADWSPKDYLQLMFNVGGHRVSVHPRKPEDPLYPNKLDKQLSGDSVKTPLGTLAPADTPAAVTVKDICYDRLEVVVFGELAAASEVQKEEVRWEYIGAATTAANKFLAHCRVAARDPDIRGIEWLFSFNQKEFFLAAPYTFTWCREENDQLVEVLTDPRGERLEGYACGAVASPLRRPVSIADVAASLTAGGEPDLATSLLVIAKGLIETDSLREGIIDMASACEVASEDYLRRKGMAADRAVERLLKQKVSFAERRFHLVTTHVQGRSLKTDDAPAFDLVEKMYKTRNALAHEGRLGYFGPGRKWVDVDRPTINEFWRATERAVDWLAAL